MPSRLAQSDGQALGIPNQATARATEAMRYEDGAWKLAARWDYAVDLNAGPCA